MEAEAEMKPVLPHREEPHHYILRVGVVGEGAVIKHDLVEGLGADLSDP